ncbi:MAG: hypothetical protein AMJ72_13480 [Acidithiobacillales bacterium SM1_46]|nr:MAG: hypothetical protein AMJ72_13480 [Acidithiobacillales bacterium SM1_46]
MLLASGPLVFNDQPVGENNWNASCSKEIVVMNRYSGAIVWRRVADNAFHHNTIIVGNDILFCIDRLPPGQEANLNRRGITPADVNAQYKLLALKVWTADEIWSTTESVFGTWLSYSEEHDILLQGGRQSADMVSGEPGGRLITYRGSDGAVQWEKSTDVDLGPYLLHGDVLYMQQSQYRHTGALDLLTGEVHMRKHPMTGEFVPWRLIRNKGCGTALACQNLLTFRSGAAAYYDLTNNGGVGNLGGFRSSCTSNLVAANGVLNAPEYTLSCTCSYQNQTSLAMVHMPGVEMWTHSAVDLPNGSIKRAGINFGAPGDRIADNSTLWMEYPVASHGDTAKAGHTFPNLDVQIEPRDPKWFRHHSVRFGGENMGWVTASGAVGLTSATIALGNSEERPYRVRLYFAEPEGVGAGRRLFDVALQGQQVLAGVVQDFDGIMAGEHLTLTLTACAGAQVNQPAICGIEVLAEEVNAAAQHR